MKYYDADTSVEFASCAVGGFFGPRSKGKKDIDIVLEFLAKLPHRGASIAVRLGDGKAVMIGDGAGVSCDIDWDYYQKIFSQLNIKSSQNRPCAIGNFFLPIDPIKKEESKQKISEILQNHQISILGKNWREIPFESDDSEEVKKIKLQNFEQIFLTSDKDIDSQQFEEILSEVHKEIEEFAHQLNLQSADEEKRPKLAVASISSKRVIYKGMILPDEVANFSDLKNSNPTNIVYHIRQSTNVSPTPGNAQPFMVIAHNGELNSVDGNVYKNHRPLRNFSDSRIFDEHLRFLLAKRKNIIEVLTTLMIPPNTKNQKIDEMLMDMRSQGLDYNGPAHIVFCVDNIQGAKLDSSALRPSRYVVARDVDGKDHLYIGSEDMFSDEMLKEMGLSLQERGMLNAGEMIILQDGKIKHNYEILEDLSKAYQKTANFTQVKADISGVDLNDKLDLGNLELQIRKYQLLPLLKGDTNKIAMGSDTNPLETDPENISILSNHFKQKFSQVSSPPLDSQKERNSFNTSINIGGEELTDGKIRNLYQISSPVLKFGELEKLKEIAKDKIAQIDFSFPLDQKNDEEILIKSLRKKINEICQIAQSEIKKGKSIIILDGTNASKNNFILPDILVVGAVDYYLHKKNLNKKVSLIVNSTQIISAHHFSVLASLGASAINPANIYNFAKETALNEDDFSQDRIKQFLQYCENISYAITKAHLVTMGKYGINSASVYCGSRLIETLTLDLTTISNDDQSDLGNAFAGVSYSPAFPGKFNVDDVLKDELINHNRKYGGGIFNSGYYAYSVKGVSHSYNPTVVSAIRSCTSDYKAKRTICENYQEKSQILLAEQSKTILDFASYKENLLSKINSKSSEIENLSTQFRLLKNENDKLLNSLFFIDGLAKQLRSIFKDEKKSKKIIAELFEQEEKSSSKSSSSNEKATSFLINQFLHAKENIDKNLLHNLLIESKNNISNLKKFLFENVGFDSSQMNEIEAWGKFIREENFSKAGELFDEMNDKNKNFIIKINEEYQGNEAKISQLKTNLSNNKKGRENDRFLLSIASKSKNEKIYKENLKTEYAKCLDEINKNNLLPKIKDGAFDKDQINQRLVDEPFKKAMQSIIQNKEKYRVSIADHLDIKYEKNIKKLDRKEVASVSDILANHFITGGMSHGALTFSAHNDVAKAAKLSGTQSCTGEGGKPEGQDAKVVQIASGRFALTPEYFEGVSTVEIKIVQGAKPGEGGMLPAGKVSVEIAAVRASLPKIDLISPPPHHDIYSIEDLQELIHDIKELKPNINVCVKLCASKGISQIAIGVAKSGADIINIASDSGGTGAAAIDAIKNTGFPSEVGLVMSHQALTNVGIRDLVKLQVSGFPNTPEGMIKMAILGGDILESGTTDIMLLGCDMHRKCNIPGACSPGITNNEAGYQGHAEDLALFKVNMAIAVQELLQQLGVKTLKELQGQTDLLDAGPLKEKVNDKFIKSLLSSNNLPQLPKEDLNEYRKKANDGSNLKQYEELESKGLKDKISDNKKSVFEIEKEIDVINRTFGSTFASSYYKALESKEIDHITIKTSGTAGQSFGAFNINGLCLEHTGSVQDGFGKSMSGGILVVKQPESEINLEKSIYVGNAALYGAIGGKAFVYGAGSRCAVLMKGATLVVNGNIGNFGCEYMTSGSFLCLGKVGQNFGAGMSGGIAALYENKTELSDDVRIADKNEAEPYLESIRKLLEEDFQRTQNTKAKFIIDNFEATKNKFTIVIPKSLDKIKNQSDLRIVEESFAKRYIVKKLGFENAVSPLEKVWLKIAKEKLIGTENSKDYEKMFGDFSRNANQHVQRMSIYGQVGSALIGGLGVPDQQLPDDAKELSNELFSHSKKCSCDSATCAPEKTDFGFQTSTGCPVDKEPNLINAILNDPKLSAQEKIKSAFLIQTKNSPFIAFTGFACPAPCQSSCTHSAVDDGNAESVKIKRIELLLHEIANSNGLYDELFKTSGEKSDAKIMIIGSGPAALEAAYHLAKKNMQVVIYEKSENIGGLLRYGIPDHKLRKDVIDFYVTKLKKMGVQFNVGQNIDMQNLVTNYPGYDLYLDARGISESPKIFDQNFSKTNISEGGNHSMAMDFLTYCNQYFEKQSNWQSNGEKSLEHPFIKFRLGKKVIVLGSGDTAVDVLDSIFKLNQHLPENEKVIVINPDRQPEKNDRAKIGSSYPYNREMAYKHPFGYEKNISEVPNTAAKEFIVENNNKIVGVRFDDTYYDVPEVARKYRITPRTIGNKIYNCDSVITAIGFDKPYMPPQTVKDLSEIKRGSIVPIGDVATKSGFAKNGLELIVSSQKSAIDVVNQFYNQLENELREKI